MIIVAVAVVTAIVGAVVALLLLTGDDESRPDDLSFNGTPLAPFVLDGPDPAFGQKAPLFWTEYLDGGFAFVGGGGGPNDTAKLVMFVAHWCPACQEEVAATSAWVSDNGVPEGVEIVMVSTFPDPDRDNHPPSDWFESVGWTAPVPVDSSSGEIAERFGMSTVPSWVVLSDLNFVLGRGVGPLGTERLEQLIDLAAASR